MNIYVDFDDVLCETARYFTRLVQRLFAKDVPYEKIKFFNLQKSFSLNDDEFTKMMDIAHSPEELLSYAETPGARECIERWAALGHDIKIVTGRPFSSKAASEQWLCQHGFKNLEIIFVDKYGREQPLLSKDRQRALTPEEFLKMKFDFAIDDSPSSFELLEKLSGCKVAIFDRPWNQNYKASLPNWKRCADWKEIEKFFNESF